MGAPDVMRERLCGRVDAAELVALRVLFGLLMAVTMVRFWASGWVERFFVEPRFFFTYLGFDWIAPGPGWFMTALVFVLAALGVAMALGHRWAGALFVLGFAYLEAIDVTNYLNHHYLAALIGALLVIAPVWRGTSTVPRWALWLMRFQVGVVYVHAGLAKMNAEWLLSGEPLGIWFAARSDLAVIGPLLALPAASLVASWSVMLFELAVVPLLLWRPSRGWAFAALVAFHAATWSMFDIGIFPVLMPLCATVFFAPDWPRRFVPLAFRAAHFPQELGGRMARATDGKVMPAAGMAALALFCAVQALVPLRHLAYPGDVLWNENGMRWSWKVMVREKHGSVTYHVRLPGGRDIEVSPARYLTPRQEREMAAQPDLILQLAHHIAGELARDGHGPVQVRAHALASLNGRAPRLLVDPDRDLARVPDGLAPTDWVLGERARTP